MWFRRSWLALALVTLSSGCILQRAGTGAEDAGQTRPDAATVDGAVGDAGGRMDAMVVVADAGPDADVPGDDGGRDGGFDAGGCADGTVDLDGDPTNGCECVIEPQRCVGVDDDCDRSIDEGCDCTVGAERPCGTSDTGECRRGTQLCGASGWGACTGAVEPQTETCNGLDDDCNGVADAFSEACGSSVGRCTEGMRFCSAGSWGPCSGITPIPEVCDMARVNEDCDSETNEGCDCDGFSTGPCTVLTCTGTRTCDGSGSWGTCRVGSTFTETCDGTDGDCNGVIDDGLALCEVATGCGQVRLGTGVYLLCYQRAGSDRRRGWADARDYCAGFGYHLVTIDDGTENAAVRGAAHSVDPGDWWIGAHDIDDDGMIEWVGPPGTSFDDWRTDEPDDGECGVLDTDAMDWETRGCGGSRGFICEAPAP